MNFGKTTELQETINDIIQDVILVEAMTLRMEQRSTAMADLPQALMEQTFGRVLDYLSQHALDLHILMRNADA